MTDELMEKAERVGKIAAVIILFLAFLMITWMLYCVFTVPKYSPGVLPEYQKIKIEKYCRERGVRPEVIEITSAGKMTYVLNGKRCEIK